jgi:hypothetical protein
MIHKLYQGLTRERGDSNAKCGQNSASLIRQAPKNKLWDSQEQNSERKRVRTQPKNLSIQQPCHLEDEVQAQTSEEVEDEVAVALEPEEVRKRLMVSYN